MLRNKLYILILVACVMGVAWIIMLQNIRLSYSPEPDVCLFKYLTNIPCPSCGSSSSVMAIIRGDIYEAFYYNPFGFLIFAIMVITPVWITGDLLLNRSSFFHFYKYIEILLIKRWIAIPAILLVLINWAWNIKKHF